MHHLSLNHHPDFSMAVQTNIPPDVTDADRAIIFQTLDHDLNSALLNSLLQGLPFYLYGYSHLIVFASTRLIHRNCCCHAVEYL